MSAPPGPSASPAAMLAHAPHRRLNALSGEWVLVSPHRMQRPWQGRHEPLVAEQRPPFDPTCYLCPGNSRAGGERNPAYTNTFVFENDFPALRAGSDTREQQWGELLVAQPESGICRVVCFSPRHDLSLADMPASEIRGVIDAWADEYLRLGHRPDIGHVQIFENKGELMGCSNPHPHGQIWAQTSVPLNVAREESRFRQHYDRHRRTLLEDYLRIELDLDERVVCVNDAWVAVVPFWAVWPYETLIMSRRPVPHLAALHDSERDLLADMMKRLTAGYDRLFDVSFPYSAGFHQAPTDDQAHPDWHMHLHFYPPLLRSATVRKFLVGYEMLAEAQRDMTPEAAAERLRSLMSSRT